MSENPYAPPSAEVADVRREELSLERPQIVTIGIWLLWLQVLISIPGPVISTFRALEDGPAGPRYLKLAFVLLIIGFTAFLTLRAGQGRNWARLGHLVLLILRIASVVSSYLLIRKMFPERVGSLYSLDDPQRVVLLLVNYLLSVVAVLMLFTPSANDWYRAVRGANPWK